MSLVVSVIMARLVEMAALVLLVPGMLVSVISVMARLIVKMALVALLLPKVLVSILSVMARLIVEMALVLLATSMRVLALSVSLRWMLSITSGMALVKMTLIALLLSEGLLAMTLALLLPWMAVSWLLVSSMTSVISIALSSIGSIALRARLRVLSIVASRMRWLSLSVRRWPLLLPIVAVGTSRTEHMDDTPPSPWRSRSAISRAYCRRSPPRPRST